MKPLKIFLIIATVLLITVFSLNCQKDTHEEERVAFANNLNDKFNAAHRAQIEKFERLGYDVPDLYISIRAHGPRHKHLTIQWSYDDAADSMSRDAARDEAVKYTLLPLFIDAIDIGFTNLSFVQPNFKIDFYPDKNYHCWKVK